MLVGAKDDRVFQAYLDRMEQRLHVRTFPILMGAARLQLARGGIQSQAYIHEHFQPALARHIASVYRDVYNSVWYRDQKAARTGLTQFMREKLSYLDQAAAQHVSGISQSATDGIRDAVIAGVRAGRSNADIADDIYAAMPDMSRARAATIARTETHSAAMAATAAVVQHSGIDVKSKTWVSAHDNRVRSSHVALNGVTVPYDQPFDAAGGQMLFPGDDSLGAGAEEIVNCRCAVLYNT
jgi:uncharacterized protein with gpF-like domain